MTSIQSFTAAGGVWVNQPAVWSRDDTQLRFTTDAETDFWQQTYYGFQRHSGHAFGFYVEDDFTVQMRVQADFSALYDQAGLLVLDDEHHWIKAGIEFNDDQPAMGCVVTRTLSDWSTGVYPGDPRLFWLRATLQNAALRIQYSTDGEHWPLLRLCPWPGRQRRFVGVMGCTPQRAGLQITFDEFTLGAPCGKALHDLT